MRFLTFVVLAIAIVAGSAKPSGVWWGGHGPVSPGAVVVGPAGTISVGPSHSGVVVPGAGWNGVWTGWPHGYWGYDNYWW